MYKEVNETNKLCGANSFSLLSFPPKCLSPRSKDVNRVYILKQMVLYRNSDRKTFTVSYVFVSVAGDFIRF